jgi:hypothetical protein
MLCGAVFRLLRRATRHISIPHQTPAFWKRVAYRMFSSAALL